MPSVNNSSSHTYPMTNWGAIDLHYLQYSNPLTGWHLKKFNWHFPPPSLSLNAHALTSRSRNAFHERTSSNCTFLAYVGTNQTSAHTDEIESECCNEWMAHASMDNGREYSQVGIWFSSVNDERCSRNAPNTGGSFNPEISFLIKHYIPLLK